MTFKRDLKRRVRLRQAATGESYVTALRHVRAAVEPDEPAMPPAVPAIDVRELVDLTEIGAALGMRCPIVMHPELVGQVEVGAMLRQLRAALGTPQLAVMCAAVMRGDELADERDDALDADEVRAFHRQLARGRTVTSPRGRMTALTIAHPVTGVWQVIAFMLVTPPAFAPTSLPVRLLITAITDRRRPGSP
ncbi:MAG TPA: hypothetical protein VFP84_10365 [Kofleriaceae bacterium]|nr:hypothetical protein [Kofleriaceae bacterium]